MGHAFSYSSTTKRQQRKLIVKDVEATATELLQPVPHIIPVPKVTRSFWEGKMSRVLQS